MYLKLSAQLSQKLSLSPQLIKSINLMSLSVTELEQAVRQELIENPTLEERGSLLEEDTSTFTKGEFTQWTHLKSLPEDYPQDNVSFQEQETLKDHLAWQVQMGGYSLNEKKNIHLLIEEMDDTGYLRESVQSLSERYEEPYENLEQALFKIQEMDPPGVGARNLKECLLIQARHLQEDTKDFVHLIENHLEDIQDKNYEKISSSMNLHKEEVMDMVSIIVSMEPQPGNLFSQTPIEYVVPDIFIVKKETGYIPIINEDRIPKLKISTRYIEVLNRMSSESLKQEDGKTKEYLMQNIKKAIVFIKGLQQRRKNLVKLGQTLVKEQVEFFEKGEPFLKPMLLKDMAQKMEVHLSTVSRLVNNKFVYTPQGTFKLKHFFGSVYENKDGVRYSRQRIKEMVKKVILEETIPLSDEKICQIISSSTGIDFERRQISRLRMDLGFKNVKDRLKEKKN